MANKFLIFKAISNLLLLYVRSSLQQEYITIDVNKSNVNEIYSFVINKFCIIKKNFIIIIITSFFEEILITDIEF
jgi:hypothetical protein